MNEIWDKSPMDKQMMSMDFAAAEARVMGSIFDGLKMTSREIAEVTTKTHFHVVRDIKVLIDQGAISASNFGVRNYEYYAGRGQQRTAEEYVLDFKATYVLILGYDAVRRAAVIDRWMELEEERARAKAREPIFKIPQTHSEALRLAADQAEKIERDAPKVAFVDEVVNQSEGLMTLGDYGRVLKDKHGYDTGAKKIFKQLRTLGIIMEGRSLPYDRYVNQGLFVVSEKITEFRADPVTFITTKGQIYVHQKLNQLLG